MVRFKSWDDCYLFMRDYGKFTCLNCDHSGANLDAIEQRIFCSEWIAMVELQFQFVCDKWSQGDEVITDENMDCPMWDLSEDILKTLEETDKEWTIEEIKELVENEKVEE